MKKTQAASSLSFNRKTVRGPPHLHTPAGCPSRSGSPPESSLHIKRLKLHSTHTPPSRPAFASGWATSPLRVCHLVQSRKSNGFCTAPQY